MRWEQHTEFTTYTWLTGSNAAEPFAYPDPIGLGEINFTPHGKLIASVHMSVIAPGTLPSHPAEGFNSLALCVINASEGAARVTTDFQVDAKGFLKVGIKSGKPTTQRSVEKGGSAGRTQAVVLKTISCSYTSSSATITAATTRA